MQPSLNQVRMQWNAFLGPGFLVFVLLTLFVTPGTPLDKMTMICFGI